MKGLLFGIGKIMVTFTLVVSLACCKRKDTRVWSSHIFWFDKATADSLKAHQIEFLWPSIQGSVNGVLSSPVVSSNLYFEAPPSPGRQDIMKILSLMNKGETITVTYTVMPMQQKNSKDFSGWGTIQNWQGTMMIAGGETVYTKLEWK